MRHIVIAFLLFTGTQLLAQQRFVQEFRTDRNDAAVAVQQVENKEFLMLNQRFGLANADSFAFNLTKMSDLGRQRWSRDYDFDFPVLAGDMVWWPAQNAYLVSAASAVDSVRDKLVARINSVGTPVWTYRLGAGSPVQTQNSSRTRILPAQDADTAFVVAAGAAQIVDNTGENDLLLAKLDADGNLLWERSYCFSCLGNFDASLGDLIQTSDGGYLLGGALVSDVPSGLRQEALLVKTDPEGLISWVRTYGADSIAQNFALNAANLAETKPGQYLWTGNYFNPDNLETDGVFVLVNASDTIPFSTRWNLDSTTARIFSHDLLLRDTSGKGLVVMAATAIQDTLPPDAAREYNFLAAVTADSLQVVWAKDYFPESDANFTTPAHALTATVDGGYAYFISIDTQMVNSNAVLVKTNDMGITACEEDLLLTRDTLPLVMTERSITVTDLSDIDTIELKEEMAFNDIMPTMEGLELTGGGGLKCEPFMDTLDATVQEAQSYLWNTGETTPMIVVSTAGQFTVEVSSEALCFYLPDTTTVNVLPPPDGIATADLDSLCEEREALLFANGTPVFTYTWSTGEMTPEIRVNATGTYTVTLTNTCGTKVIEVAVPRLGCLCDVIFPNAFTPDNDSNNDTFQPVFDCPGITEFQFFVYNRWGENVFAGTSQTDGWNGENNGSPAPSDVYVWYATYIDIEGEKVTQKGDVTLLR
ncbi:MAG: gliding motility-associated C-terminal domain-containing protein [Lewinellaceae bacterium]|nr:gliding motility-associated C-terminal domain-containing protein [Lewinellaceae bacterium]